MQFKLICQQYKLLSDEGGEKEGSCRHLNVLDLYINDVRGRLSPFEVLHKKISLYQPILQENVLAFRHLHVIREQSFRFMSLKR